ncbi:MAG: fumarylacetoacetate hydrolase family protein [Chloroflexota bacterium]
MRDDDRTVPIDTRATGLAGIRAIAAGGAAALDRLQVWLDAQPAGAGRPLDTVTLGPAVPDPGAIYTVGLNYDGRSAAPRPERPLIYGKAAASVAGHGATLAWDRAVTDDVDAEVELAVVIGTPAFRVTPEDAMSHVFGYTCLNDVSARDERLDGDQWLIGKSMPGFCPVGPWIVTADAFDPANVALRCTIDGAPIQESRTASMRFGIPEIVAYLSQHLELRPGDLIATGTPPRLATPPGPERRLQPGDTVTVSIEGIGRLTTTIG